MIKIYWFKVSNSIGNVLTIGKMAASEEEVIEHCEKAIMDARNHTDCKWHYEIELIPNEKKSIKK